jgi:hypothetical protein
MTLRARDIIEIGEDLGLERISVTAKEGWDHTPTFHMTFGPLAYRQLVEIKPGLDAHAVKAKLEAARAHPIGGDTIPATEEESSPVAAPGAGKGKRKRA